MTFASEALDIDAVLPLMCRLSHKIVEEGLSREHLPPPARRHIDLHDPPYDFDSDLHDPPYDSDSDLHDPPGDSDSDLHDPPGDSDSDL